MSSSIWTRCAGDSELRALRLSPWRVVESQHQVSTRKLVDSADEQALLEQLIDGAKPPDLTGGRLHYLLFTPFRYPPLPHGSRFGRRHQRGIWYGSLERRTAFAEVAYYRLLFLEGTQASLGTITTPLTAFRASLRTTHGVSLDALVGGDDAKAREWLHAANDHLGGVPADRIRSVEGLVDVVQYLDAMRGRL